MNAKGIDFPTTANITDVKDEDNMASDSATMLATQQSIKKYVDDNVGGVVTGDVITTAPLQIDGTTNVNDILPGADVDRTFSILTSTTTAQGSVELSTDAESVTGASDAVVVTPGTLTARLAAPGAIGGTTPATDVATDSVTITPDSDPGWTGQDSDDAAGTWYLYGNSSGGANDIIMSLGVEDSSGESTEYMQLDGVTETVDMLKPTTLQAGDIVVAEMAVNSVDSDQYVDASIDEEHLGVNARGSLAPMEDDPDNFAGNFTGENLYGGTFIANAAGTAALPKAAVLMNFTYVVKGDNANVIDPDETGTDDTIMMNGLDAAQNENLESSTTGHICVFQYYKADFWMATCNGFVEATP